MKQRFGIVIWAAVCLITAPSIGFGQSSNATVSGTVADASKALIPGVTITAKNVETGVTSTTITNEGGAYNLPGLLPGVYTVSAELSGFQTQTFTDVRLGSAAQARLNFELKVAAANTTVDVTFSADRLLIESTSSVGAVLPETAVRELPIVGVMGNDAINLVKTLPGVNLSSDLILAANDSKIAGVSAANVVVQRDGVDASAGGRWPAGFQGATVVNPDLVGEIRMVVSPVDAEIGGGNAQIQIQTRSGTNRYRGSAVWNIRNSAFDGNTWANNRVQPTPTPRSWTNINEGYVSFGGPIVKNKTFFFLLYDQLVPLTRTEVNATVLTPCAARGIFRYFDGWSNGNAQATESGGATPRIAVVDFLGNPRTPDHNPDGSKFTGQLRYASVFGPLTTTPTKADCSDAVVQGSAWDPNRRALDSTGYVAKVLGLMPAVNNYDIGEGLNTAGHRWIRRTTGTQNRFGFGFTDYRKQMNTKIDHQFNSSNKVNFSWTFERVHADYGQTPWDTARFDGIARRFPQVLGVNYTSTISANIVNEVRWGMRRTGTNTIHSLASNLDAAKKVIPEVQGIPVVMHLGLNALTQAPVICFCGGQPLFQTEAGNLFNGNIAEKSPLYTYADTLSWNRGVHSFKMGAEAKFTSSELRDDVDSNSWSTFARAFGGETQYTPIQGITSGNMPGLQGTSTTGNVLAMRSLLTLLSGSLSEIHQMYWLGSADRLEKFDDYRTSVQRTRQLNQREFSTFLKDDWKFTRDVTLNLGVRWDYYGIPWVSNGLTVSPQGGGDALFGYSGRGFQNWMQFGKRGDNTQLIFVGPDSPNPGLNAWPKDYNNFGPAVGFAWNIPYFGAGKTILRGGYQVSYLVGGGRFNTLNGPLANPPGSSYNAVFNGATGLEYLDLSKINSLVPVPITQKPMQPISERDRSVALTAIDSNYTTPNIQNLTLALTRNVGRNLTVDARYIGTLSRKLYDSININSPDFLYNGLKDAFDAARYGGESALLDQMFKGINVAGTGCATASGTAVTCGVVGSSAGGVVQTGAMHLRAASSGSLRNNLANGNYSAVATTLSTLNYSKTSVGNASLPDIPAGELGAVLRYTGFPENFIKTNPQFSTATLLNNLGNTNYHSLQLQTTIRRLPGISDMQASYTWSKLLGRMGPYTNPIDRIADYTLQPGDVRHDFRTNGTFELPVGPGQLLAGKSSGLLAQIIGGWKMSWIVQFSSGQATNITAGTTLYANGVPDVGGAFDPSLGAVRWADGALAGNYFSEAYKKVTDPQCGTLAASIRSVCTLSAIQDSAGNIVLKNPLPATRGNLGQNVIENPGLWNFDGSFGKRFKLNESKAVTIRLDATNVFNHPQPANPNLDLNNATAFGNIATKTGVRTFQAQLRVDF